MRVIWADTGIEEEIKPGRQMTGKAVKEITSVTVEDMTSSIYFAEWFTDCVLSRLVPDGVAWIEANANHPQR